MTSRGEESIIEEIRKQMAALGSPVDSLSDSQILDNIAWIGAAMASLSTAEGPAREIKGLGIHETAEAAGEGTAKVDPTECQK